MLVHLSVYVFINSLVYDRNLELGTLDQAEPALPHHVDDDAAPEVRDPLAGKWASESRRFGPLAEDDALEKPRDVDATVEEVARRSAALLRRRLHLDPTWPVDHASDHAYDAPLHQVVDEALDRQEFLAGLVRAGVGGKAADAGHARLGPAEVDQVGVPVLPGVARDEDPGHVAAVRVAQPQRLLSSAQSQLITNVESSFGCHIDCNAVAVLAKIDG